MTWSEEWEGKEDHMRAGAVLYSQPNSWELMTNSNSGSNNIIETAAGQPL
jgi:hypothetical protein